MENVAVHLAAGLGDDLKYCAENEDYKLFKSSLENFAVEVGLSDSELLDDEYDKAVVRLGELFEEYFMFVEDTVKRIEIVDDYEDATHFAELIDIVLDGEGKWVERLRG